MAGEVGNLTVNLGLNAAGFSGGITEAGKAARKAGQDIKAGMEEGKYSMMEARHSIMMLGEEFGVHIPRGIQMMLSSLAPVGGLMAAAFPVIAIAAMVGIVEKVIAKINEYKEKAEASAVAWSKLGEDGAEALHKLNEELLTSDAKIDDMNDNHLAALHKRLQLIDEQSLDKLGDQFKVLAADADKILGGMQVGMFQKFLGKGAGVDQVLKDFDTLQTKLQGLKEAGDSKGFAAALSQGIKDTINRQDELNAHASSFHTEERAALAARLDAEILMTQEMEKQDKLATNEKTLETHKYELSEVINLIGRHDQLAETRKRAAEQAEHENEEIATSLEEIDKAMQAYNREQVVQNQKVLESEQAIAAARTKAAAAGASASAKVMGELGITSKKEEAEQIAKIDQQELAAYKAVQAEKLGALKNEIEQSAALAQQAVGTNQQEETAKTAATAVEAYNKALATSITEEQALTNKVIESAAAVQLVKSSWSSFFTDWKTEAGNQSALMVTLGKTVQSDLTQGLSGVSNALAKTAVEGKSLGNAMKNVAKEMAESFISAATQMLIKYVMLKLGMGAVDKSAAATSAVAAVAADKVKVVSAAGVAGAEGVASFAGAPWPIDMGAPAFGASMATSALGFGAAEQGGLVGYDDMIIAAHKNEMVLPANLSQKVQNMTDDKKGGTAVHVHYSPTVHAIDGKGIGQVLNEHSSVIQAHVQKALRRTNKG